MAPVLGKMNLAPYPRYPLRVLSHYPHHCASSWIPSLGNWHLGLMSQPTPQLPGGHPWEAPAFPHHPHTQADSGKPPAQCLSYPFATDIVLHLLSISNRVLFWWFPILLPEGLFKWPFWSHCSLHNPTPPMAPATWASSEGLQSVICTHRRRAKPWDWKSSSVSRGQGKTGERGRPSSLAMNRACSGKPTRCIGGDCRSKWLSSVSLHRCQEIT